MLATVLGFVVSCTPKVITSPTPMKPKIITSFSGPLFKMDYKEGELKAACDQALNTLNEKLKSPANVFEMEAALAEFKESSDSLVFLAYVSPSKWVQKEGGDCEVKVGQFMTDVFTRRDLYQIVKSTKSSNEAEARLINDYDRSFKLNGMALSDPDLIKFKELSKKLVELESSFSQNLNRDETTITLYKEELDGLSLDAFEKYFNEKGYYAIPVNEVTSPPIMNNVRISETRRKTLEAYENRPNIPSENITKETNTKLLNEAIAVRKEIANLLGFKKWSDYRIQNRMAKGSQDVMDFLNDLKTRIQPRLKLDIEAMLKAKQQEDPTATKLDAWDIRYYANLIKKQKYSMDPEEIRKYFPKDTVINGMFDIYSNLLGVTFKEVKDADVWYKDVKLYEIHDSENGELIAYFYTDFFSRKGKYNHAAAFNINTGRLINGLYSKPISSIVANFSEPVGSDPALLKFEDVETLFHEFGHIMHQTLTKAPYASLSGTSVARDFVEAPSQMLENWVTAPEVLDKISGLYTDPSKKLPKEIVEKLIALKDFNQGYFYSRQITFALTDMKIHSENISEDVNKVFREMYQEVVTIPALENSNFMASFGHMMGGYDSGYYGYTWSEVYAADMFTAFEREGLLNPERGMKYRKSILEKGGMQEAIELVTEFLGRTPNREAFYKKLGL